MSIFNWLEDLGIVVNDENLIRKAFIHSSYANEHDLHYDNERLEFVGDAILQSWISVKLYAIQPALNEGQMSKLRAKLVCEDSLSEATKRLGLNKYLYLGSGEDSHGGRNKPSICCDLFEAFNGALYLSNGYSASSLIFSMALDEKLAHIDLEDIEDYKSKLQEYVQGDTRKNVTYQLIRSIGPSNAPCFEVAVKLDGIVLGVGSGASKKKAEQMAAKDAFNKMVK